MIRPHRLRAIVMNLRTAEQQLARVLDPAPIASEEIHRALEEAKGLVAGVVEVLEDCSLPSACAAAKED